MQFSKNVQHEKRNEHSCMNKKIYSEKKIFQDRQRAYLSLLECSNILNENGQVLKGKYARM